MKKKLLIAALLTSVAAVSFAQGPTPSPTVSTATSTAKPVHKVKHAHTAKKATAPVATPSVAK
jgi:Flp pilus assembly protein TadD